MDPSNRSTSPFWEQPFKSESTESHFSRTSPTSSRAKRLPSRFGTSTKTSASWCAPLVSRKARLMSTMVLPRQCITSRGDSVTTATSTASKFSWAAYSKNSFTSFGSTTTAMRSWDSEMAISVPSNPAYFLGTLSRSIRRPAASSPMATDTPPAPKSLHFLIRRLTSGLRNMR